MTIRPATKDDIRTIVDVLRRACGTVAERFGLTLENCPKSPAFYTVERAQADFERGVQYFLLAEAAQTCGCVALEQAKPGVAYLERLGVVPEHRGRGFGRALVDHIIALARSSGLERIEIAVISEDAPLKAWYDRFGFVETRTQVYEHLPFTVAFMAMDLQRR